MRFFGTVGDAHAAASSPTTAGSGTGTAGSGADAAGSGAGAAGSGTGAAGSGADAAGSGADAAGPTMAALTVTGSACGLECIRFSAAQKSSSEKIVLLNGYIPADLKQFTHF